MGWLSALGGIAKLGAKLFGFMMMRKAVQADVMKEQLDDIRVADEVKKKINHALIGLAGTQKQNLKKIISHPQALQQCSKYLNKLDHKKFKKNIFTIDYLVTLFLNKFLIIK